MQIRGRSPNLIHCPWLAERFLSKSVNDWHIQIIPLSPNAWYPQSRFSSRLWPISNRTRAEFSSPPSETLCCSQPLSAFNISRNDFANLSTLIRHSVCTWAPIRFPSQQQPLILALPFAIFHSSSSLILPSLLIAIACSIIGSFGSGLVCHDEITFC